MPSWGLPLQPPASVQHGDWGGATLTMLQWNTLQGLFLHAARKEVFSPLAQYTQPRQKNGSGGIL